MNFDLMRLIAALLVVVSHTLALSGEPPFITRGVEDLGALGVSVFFVISGYLIAASYRRDPRTYLLKRVLRIEPGLIASLIVTVVLLSFVTTAPPAEYWREGVIYVVRNALLYPVTYELPGVFEATPMAGIVNGVLWTLRLEFTFYIVLMLIRARLAIILGLLALCAAVFVWVSVYRPEWGVDPVARVAFLTSRNGMLFFAGAALQVVNWRTPFWLGIASWIALPFVGPVALPTAVLGLAREGKLPADLSYGVYIYAFPIQQLLVTYGHLNHATAILAVLPFAAASWFLVEKPALKLKPGPRPAW